MRVYVAGPYTRGDVVVNTRNAITAGNAVRDAGHTPFIPHLTHFWHMLYPRPYEDWLHYDMAWLLLCDVLIRLPGESSGADKEVEAARGQGMPIYGSVEEFLEAENGRP